MREGRVYAVCRNIKRDIRELARDPFFLIQALERIFAFLIIGTELCFEGPNIENRQSAQRSLKFVCSFYFINEWEAY